MSAPQIDPEAVIRRLAQQIGGMSAELAMRDAALEAAHERIAELEKADELVES
jgi:hypothetical protein